MCHDSAHRLRGPRYTPRYTLSMCALLAILMCASACGNGRAGVTVSPDPAREGPKASRITMRSASVHVSSDAPRTAVSASCQTGEQMIGGGFAASDTFEYAAIIAASYPASATTWTVAATSGPGFMLNVEVYCLWSSIDLDVKIVHAPAAPDGAVACPAGSILLSGGFQGDSSSVASRPEGNGWYAGGARSAGQVYALCASQHMSAGVVVSARFNPHSSVHSYYPAGQSVTCPVGQTATAGGFSGSLVITSASAGAPYVGWSVIAGGDGDVTVYARCVTLMV
jgi:hypothetical protein